MTHCASENAFPSAGLGWTPPDPIRCALESDRLVIRGYTLDDAQAVFEAINDSRDGHLLPWMPWCKENHRTLESTVKYICEQALACEQMAGFTNVGTGVFCKESGRFLGGSGVHDVRRDTASCETGYWIRKDAIGNGYAREACARTISWALEDQSRGGLGLKRVRLYCSGANEPSKRVIEGIGLRQEVHQRQDYFIDGIGATDRLGWGVLQTEWDCQSHRMIDQAH